MNPTITTEQQQTKLASTIIAPKSGSTELSDNEAGNGDDDSTEELCAICGIGETDEAAEWIGCDVCLKWYHLECVGLTKSRADRIKKYICNLCKPDNNTIENTLSIPVNNNNNPSTESSQLEVNKRKRKPSQLLLDSEASAAALQKRSNNVSDSDTDNPHPTSKRKTSTANNNNPISSSSVPIVLIIYNHISTDSNYIYEAQYNTLTSTEREILSGLNGIGANHINDLPIFNKLLHHKFTLVKKINFQTQSSGTKIEKYVKTIYQITFI